MKHYLHELKQFNIGIALLILTSIVPILNAVRIYYVLPNFLDSTSIVYFFYKMGPFSLGMSGFFLLINCYFLSKNKNSALWYVQLICITFVGVNDSIGAMFFYKFSGYRDIFVLLPLVVTLLQWLGLWLVKADVFEKNFDINQVTTSK